jgi:hypothetical protein
VDSRTIYNAERKRYHLADDSETKKEMLWLREDLPNGGIRKPGKSNGSVKSAKSMRATKQARLREYPPIQ